MDAEIIGLIAIRSEARPLLNSIDVTMSAEHIQARFHQGHLAGQPVVLAEVGPGKVQTAAVTQHLIDHYRTGLMVSCGSAGALSPALQIGDVILAKRITMHDVGLYANNRFQHLGFYDYTHPDGLHFHRALVVDPALLATARQAAAALNWPRTPPAIHIGGLASGDQVMADNVKKQWLYNTFDALAIDMESGAMAQVASLNQVPWLAIRAISDNADATLDFGQLDFISYSDAPGGRYSQLQKAARVIVNMAQKPSRLTSALKFRQAMRRAAENAARVTIATIATKKLPVGGGGVPPSVSFPIE
ncbi:MAG: 5'-methylthioadenosine/S-adenosylhomocysteine nucleosidase [Anaerolineae bacterium]|nr:5'-methylthioadenosine/S-adenosylhomocysteine nucleosidase [Anaerolineae bacterium]